MNKYESKMDKHAHLARQVLAFLRKQSAKDINMLSEAMHLDQRHYSNRNKRIFGLLVAMGASFNLSIEEMKILDSRIFKLPKHLKDPRAVLARGQALLRLKENQNGR